MTRRSKIVKPTSAEQKIITARLKKKYPQMFQAKLSLREQRAFKDLSVADQKTLLSMVESKLKKIYR